MLGLKLNHVSKRGHSKVSYMRLKWLWYIVNTFNNGFHSWKTNPLHELILNCHQWCPVTLTLGRYIRDISKIAITKDVFENYMGEHYRENINHVYMLCCEIKLISDTKNLELKWYCPYKRVIDIKKLNRIYQPYERQHQQKRHPRSTNSLRKAILA